MNSLVRRTPGPYRRTLIGGGISAGPGPSVRFRDDGPPPEPRRGRLALLLGIIAVVLLALIAGSVYLLTRGRDELAGRATPVPTALSGGAGLQPPAVAIVAPLGGTSWELGQDVIVQSQATDDQGVMRVELWVDGVLVRSDASPQANGQSPFIVSQPWRAGGVGSHALISRAYDAAGGMSMSAPVIVVVVQPGPTPSVTPEAAEPTAEPTAEALPSPTQAAADTATPTAAATQAPTATASRTPTATAPATPACSRDVDASLIAAWSLASLGCPTGPAAIIWSAWQPFQHGDMFWRQDSDWAYALHWRNGNDPTRGDWSTGSNAWRWDGSFEDGHGLTPPPGLYEPIRGFGYVWYNFSGGPDSRLGWATDQEKGVCARIQAFDKGTIVRSTKVPECAGNFNRGQEPSFNHFLFALYTDGSWRMFTP